MGCFKDESQRFNGLRYWSYIFQAVLSIPVEMASENNNLYVCFFYITFPPLIWVCACVCVRVKSNTCDLENELLLKIISPVSSRIWSSQKGFG